ARGRDRARTDEVEPRRERPRARRDGEVHLLRAAHPRRADPGAERRARVARRRRRHGVPAGLPDGRHRLRRHRRSQLPRRALAGRAAGLCGARQPWDATADALSRADRQRERGPRRMTTHAGELLLGAPSDAELTERLAAPLPHVHARLRLALLGTGALALVFLAAITYTILTGIGTWGTNVPVGW